MSTPDIDGYIPLTTVAFEILLAVAGRDRTGYQVMLAIEERTGGRLNPNPGTLYRAIDRLVGTGLIACQENRAPSGRERRILTLSPLGATVLRAETERLAAQVSAARAIGSAKPEPG